MARILVAGCGDIGSLTAQRWRSAGHQVVGLRRRIAALPEAIEGIAADLTDATSLSVLEGQLFDLVLVASSAGAFTRQAYQQVYVDGLVNLLRAVSGKPSWLLVSSTGVYHQTDGEWVNEESATCPASFSGQALLRAEQILADKAPADYSIVRFGGIYGPGRTRMLDDVRAGKGCPRSPVQYTNRIHRNDCAGILDYLGTRLLASEPVSKLYLGVDKAPAPMWEVRQWIAQRLELTLDDTLGNLPSRGGNKRCSNARLLGAGYRFEFPDYRAGYGDLIAAEIGHL